MCKKLVLLSLVFLRVTCFAETFINMQGSKTLTISSNEAIIFKTISSPFQSFLIKNGVTNVMNLSADEGFASLLPRAIAGPAIMLFTSETVLSFSRVNGTNIQTLIIPPNTATNLTIPTNKVFHFLQGINNFPRTTILEGTNSISFDFYGSLELAGELNLRLTNGKGQIAPMIVSFYATEDFLVVPDLGLLRSPTGNFEITVEKSVDLANWFPVIVQNATSDQKAFYRLRIQK